MNHYAHTNDTGELQTLENHLISVGKIAAVNSSKFNAETIGYLCGVLHDLGKYSVEFQDRLLNNGPKVDHSTAGAVEIKKTLNQNMGLSLGNAIGLIIGYVICGHHSGLMDYGSEESGLMLRYSKDIPKYNYDSRKLNLNVNYNKLKQELPKKVIGKGGFTVGFFIRMLYSSLVDADFLDTERFMNIGDDIVRGGHDTFVSLSLSFENFMTDKIQKSNKNNINSYRSVILKNCIDVALQNVNLFSLTVPTGGGKTLSSMAFALKHLQYNNLERIICVIPYTSIIEQNAKQYKDIFGERNILEHHSNFSFDKQVEMANNEEYATIMNKLKFASENWDIPIVVTTNVQFFESLFANKSSRCRKLHNVANSVVIIDEAQMLPTTFLKPSIRALEELVNNYNTSVVLMTATKPEFPKELLYKEPIEIIKDPEYLYDKLKRVEVEYVNDLSDENIKSRIAEISQVLIIVNTRNHAQKLYECLPKDDLFHLSAKMCSAHRSEVLLEIRLKLEKKKPCKVISTQLIECGVDISFPEVYRSISGIDSIAQSAGRCNREGEMDIGAVYVFNSTELHGKPISYLSRKAECGRYVLENYTDPLSLQGISKYFELLYDIEKDRLDVKDIMGNFEEGGKDLAFNFEKTAYDFRLIEETVSLIIPYNQEASGIIENLKYTEYPNSLIRKLQPYTINIHYYQLQKLIEEGVIISIEGRFHILAYLENYYDMNTGLVLGNKEILII